MRQELLFQATYVQLLKKMSWSEALSVVASELPHELALTSFKVDESGQVTFTGEAYRMESIAKLLRTIETSSILDQGQFSYLTQEVQENKKVYSFGILAEIKKGEHT
jgi:Tfp pilus assembly protein PilN